MSPSRRRVASAVAVLSLLACTVACFPSPPPPEADVCDTPTTDANVEAVTLGARFERGAQGTLMVVASPEWLGEGAPECAVATLRLLDEEGAVIATQAPALETEATDAGRRSTSGVFFLLDDEGICRVTVELESYGHAASAEAVNPDGFGCAVDAGAAADAG